MKTLYAGLIGIMVLLMVVPQAVARPGSCRGWDDQINSPVRFQVLDDFAGAAVLDRETGLVWEQSPDTTTRTWLDAQRSCNTRTVGVRLGWRLPTIQELASLLDPNNPEGNPDLPPGHPFSNVQSSFYWSATTGACNTGCAWDVFLDLGAVNVVDKTFSSHVWCVRGGQGVDPQ